MTPPTIPAGTARTLAADVLAGETNVLSNGTLWSHACTLGSFSRDGDGEWSIDAAVLASIEKNFRAGYPQKVPVDYEHETVRKDLDRAAVPFTLRAGQIAEVKAVLSLEDLTAEMKKQLDAERARRQRIGLSRDVDPLGLWIRWEPTSRALSMVKDREVTEMSVVIAFDYPHKNTGEGQGPTLLSVALTNTPFLDDMVPVAASRRDGGAPAVPAEERPIMNTKLMLAVAAVTGKPAATEDEAAEQVQLRFTALTADAELGRKATSNLALLTAEIGVSDPAGAVLKVREFKATAEKAEAESKKIRLSAIDSAVGGFLTANEKRLSSVQLKEHFKASITAEMLKDPALKVEETPSAKVVLSMGQATTLGRTAPTDSGANVNDDADVLVASRVDELLADDEEIKRIAKKDGPVVARRQAILKAAREAGVVDFRAPRPVEA
jgi:phage I-like protein